MQDHTLYEKLLGIGTPWHVDDVQLNLKEGEVRVRLRVEAATAWACPICGKPATHHDVRERQWRHLDTMQYRTVLVAPVPRVNCAEHGVHQIGVPWAEERSRFTALFEALVIDWSLEGSLSAVARLLRLSWDQVAGIQARAVQRGLARRPPQRVTRIGVDETSFQKRHEYVTVVCDLDAAKGAGVLYVGEDRTEAALSMFYSGMDDAGRDAIEHVAMDMWPAYIKATQRALPAAEDKIVFDKFHVAQHLGNAVNAVRLEEHRHLSAAGDHRLARTKYHWLRNTDAMSRRENAVFAALRATGLKVARAWAIKELAMDLWNYRSRAWAEKAWTRWYGWAIRSRLEPMKKVARMIKAHWHGILNAVVSDTTNARAESLNAKIQSIKRKACGFRNRERFKNAIYFHLGGLDLYPESLKNFHTIA